MKIANSTGTAELLNVLINPFGNVLMWRQRLDGQTFLHNALPAGHSTSMEGTAEFNQRFNTGLSLKKCGEGKYQDQGMALYSITGNQPVINALDISDVAIKALNRLSAYKRSCQ